MNPRAADPARTYAVLVAVEKYQAGWPLSGPVRDVLEFHDWLRSRGVPPEQITVLASPEDRNVALLAESELKYSPATSGVVREAFNALHSKSGDLLFIFWAGHGLVHEKQHRLFLADATENDKRNLDLDALRESLNSTYFKGFPMQILIIDACANYASLPFTLPGEELPRGDPLSYDQFVFFAARSGEVAKNLGEENRGLFSRELLQQIRLQPNSSWPPDMRGMAEKIKAEFETLRAAGQTAQTPIYEWNRDWDGSINKLKATAPPRRAGATTQPPWKLDFRQLATVTNALMACGKMNDSAGRQDVLARIRSSIAGAVSRRGDTKSDVMNIIQTASRYPGGLEELLFVVHYFDGGSAEWTNVEDAVADVLPGFKTPGASS